MMPADLPLGDTNGTTIATLNMKNWAINGI
jgi:hypothetical protein